MKIKMNKMVIFSSILFLLISNPLISQQQEFSGKPKNIILLIGDGMGVSHTEAMLTIVGDQVNLLMFEQAALVRTYSFNKYITDSAASATAFASGIKTNNGYLGVDPEGNIVPTIVEQAMAIGMATGLVASCAITHATPAAFASHVNDRGASEEIAAQMALSGVDVMIGGGRDHFSHRDDERNYLDTLKAAGYYLPSSPDELSGIESGKVAGLLYPVHPPSMKNGRGDFLGIASSKAIELLSSADKGFFLMIESSQIDWAAHKNQKNSILEELKDFNDVIGIVLDFAKKDGETLVIVTADHETGAYYIKGGDIGEKKVEGGFASFNHTAAMVPLFAYGPGATSFKGILDNTDLYHIMTGLLEINPQSVE